MCACSTSTIAGLRVFVLAEQIDEPIDVEALVARQRPSRAGDRAGIAVGEAARDQRQGLVADEAAQDFDVLAVWRLSAEARASRILGIAPVPSLPSLANSFLPVAEEGSRLLTNLRDQPIGL